jgi:TonB family protein
MAHHPISEPEPSTPASSAGKLPVTFVGDVPGAEAARLESDVAELTAKFTAYGGGKVSAETSADLALELVLYEIVEQACLATGATGAAVLFERNGEMVCRATYGTNAPELDTRLDGDSGLTAECIRTQQVQHCDDAQADPRVNVEASHQLGTRSVMVFPLLRNGNIAGVLEVFSSRAAAFGERDERTLGALAKRVLKNLEGAADPSSVAAARNSPAPRILPISGTESLDWRAELDPSLNEDVVTPEARVPNPKGGRDAVVFGLGVAVVVCTVLFGTLVGWRLGVFRAGARRSQIAKSASGADVTKRNSAAGGSAAQSTGAIADAKAATNTGPAPSAAGNATVSGKKNVTPRSSTSAPDGSTNSFPPEGSLLVYENGKEVFRMPPTPGRGELPATATSANGSEVNGRQVTGSEVRRASSVEPAGVLELSPEVAEGSLLYRVEPEYPQEARQRQMQGSVVLDVRIGRDGAVQTMNPVSGQRLLADAAIAAVKQWRFKPRTVNGHTVEMQTTITLKFRLPAGPS